MRPMPRTHILAAVTAIAVICVVDVARAQPPDLSGNWSAEAAAVPPAAPAGVPAPAPRGDMGSGWGTPLIITQTPAQLIVEHALFSRYDLQPPLRFVYQLDGGESRNTTMAGHASQTRVSKATWDGDVLSVVTLFPGIDPDSGRQFTAEMIQRVSLSSPTRLVIETTRKGVLGGRDTSTRTVYLKR
jgi:hypothetical protein